MCGSVSSLFDTHKLCVFCLGDEHARDVLEGAICIHCELRTEENEIVGFAFEPGR